MSGGLYRILGVSRTASKETIRLAYLKLAKQLHPDINKSVDAPRRFQHVREAYEVLSEDSRRREHDRQLDLRSPRAASAAEGRRPPAGAPFDPLAQSMWQHHDRARRAQQATGTGRTRQQQAEEDMARAHGRYREAFDRQRFQQRLVLSMFRAVPFLVPVWMVLLLLSLRRRRPAEERGAVVFDADGRAFVLDTFGQRHRMPDFDRQ
mmetsp:Transcript_55457/g.124960  ORF Transcript_55457/g.124960 Transcript_55457/m.124960 type:complete len:207 (+) Transcript_55457:103-723(+)